MKKLLKFFIVAAVVLLPVGFSSGVFATDGTCQIGYTGPDSKNMCTLKSTYTCKVTNKNDFDVIDSNNQVAGSGSVSSTSNTSTGSASTGQASNTNGTTFNVSVDNGTCSVLTTVPATPTPVTPGKGSTVAPSSTTQTATVPAPAPAGGKGSIAVLPNTSGDSMLASIASVIAALGVAGVVSRLAVTAYRRAHL